MITDNQLEPCCLYVVVGKLEKGKADWLRKSDAQGTHDTIDDQGCLDDNLDGFFYDLYIHFREGLGTVYRISFNERPQLMERKIGGKQLKTEGTAKFEIYPNFVGIERVAHIVGMVKIFHLSHAARHLVQRALVAKRLPFDVTYCDLVPSIKNWTLGLVNNIDELLHQQYFVPKDGEKINFPLLHSAIMGFALEHEDKSVRGDNCCPILDMGRERHSPNKNGSRAFFR